MLLIGDVVAFPYSLDKRLVVNVLRIISSIYTGYLES